MWFLDYKITHVFQVFSFYHYYRSNLKWEDGELLNLENDGHFWFLFWEEKTLFNNNSGTHAYVLN